MGIYSSDKIFGISIYNFDENDIGNTLFEQKYDEIMSHHQMREAYLFYEELQNKNNISFKIYTQCTSTHDNNNSVMMWFPISLNTFFEKFSVWPRSGP